MNKSTKSSARNRETRTKELPLKQRIKNFITDNPNVSHKEIAKHFGISSKDLNLILAKL